MPVFAALFSGIFTALGSLLARLFAVKLPVRLAAVAALAAIATALLTLFNGWIAPLVAQAFTTQYGQFIGLAFPPIAGTVITTYFVAYLAVITYKLQARAISITSNI